MKWVKLVSIFVLVVAAACSTPEHRNAFQNDSTWAMLPFKKVNYANPILNAGTGIFKCPILQQEVRWEEKDVFNPAAVVRNGAIYLFYRAEDTIGKYNCTSRI